MEDTSKKSPGATQDVELPTISGGLQQGSEMISDGVMQTQVITRVSRYHDPPIEDQLCNSLIVMICCCRLIGIFALWYALQKRSLESAGKLEAAKEASSRAKYWNYAGLCFGIAEIVTVIVYVIVSQIRN